MQNKKISKSAQEMRELIDKAIKSGTITRDEYDRITHIATEDSNIDPQEKILLANLHDLIEDKTILIVKSPVLTPIEKAISEFEKIQSKDISLKDRIYLDGVLAVLDGLKEYEKTYFENMGHSDCDCKEKERCYGAYQLCTKCGKIHKMF
jgi:hypothetical protein